jgi:nucleotide-binding universal stress UspA family protein
MKILIADDGSEFSSSAVDLAAKLIKGTADVVEVKLVTVIQPAAAMDIEMYVESLEEMRDPSNPNYLEAVKLCETSVNRLKKQLDGTASVSYEVLVGPAAQSIVELAEEWQPNLIVVGSHGRGFWERMWLGSVADRVVHHAPCSVLIAKRSSA